MKLKILSAVLALVMLISLFPMTAMAADCDHDYEYVSHGNDTHSQICSKCGDVKSGPSACGSLLGLLCWRCGGQMCQHSLSKHTSNGNGTHTSSCACGDESDTDDCTFGEDDLCTVCKGANPCDHTLNTANPNGDCTHTSTCDCGKVEETGKCTFGDNDKCTICNGVNPCNHTPKAPVSNGDGTHTSTCDCGKVEDTDECTFGDDGVCTVCKGECVHANTTLVNNGRDHSNICDDCKVVVSTNRHYYNFFTHLCNCGDADPFFQMICPHENYEIVNISNESLHEVVCRLCHVYRFYEPHGYNAAGVCACGHSKGACPHSNIGHVSKGTEYETVCKDCGIVIETSSKCVHEYNIFDICIHCGAINPNEVDPNPIEPTEPAPTYPADAWDRLDELFTTHK